MNGGKEGEKKGEGDRRVGGWESDGGRVVTRERGGREGGRYAEGFDR